MSLISSWHHLNKTRTSPKPSSLGSKPGFYWILLSGFQTSCGMLASQPWSRYTGFEGRPSLTLRLLWWGWLLYCHFSGYIKPDTWITNRGCPILDGMGHSLSTLSSLYVELLCRTVWPGGPAAGTREALKHGVPRESYCPHFEKTWQTGKDEGYRGAQGIQKTR
jgi:hypothetical protein